MMKTLVGLLAIGFIPALVVSWVFELTPEGLKRDSEVTNAESIAPQTARRMDRMIIVVLLLALGYFAFDKFLLAPGRESARAQAVLASTRPSACGLTGTTAPAPGSGEHVEPLRFLEALFNGKRA
jgi:hypothetical protein